MCPQGDRGSARSVAVTGVLRGVSHFPGGDRGLKGTGRLGCSGPPGALLVSGWAAIVRCIQIVGQLGRDEKSRWRKIP